MPVWLTALLVVGLRPIWRRSSSERSCRRTALGSMPGRICLAWLVVQRVAAGRHEVAGDPPPDAASMYWAEGHTTMQEQLMRALHRVVLESPLGRSPGTLAPDELTVPAPVAGNLVDPEPPHAVHISLFIMSPFFEPETIDMGVPFPSPSIAFMNLQRTCRGTCLRGCHILSRSCLRSTRTTRPS